MKPFSPLLLAASITFVVTAPQSLADDLFSEKNAGLWEFVSATPTPLESILKYGPDGLTAVSGKPNGYLSTNAPDGGYRLHFEWRWPAGAPANSNGGVLINVSSGPANGTPWPVSFQVQLKIGHAGDLLPMAGGRFAENLTTAPDAKVPQLDRKAGTIEKPPGEWNTGDVVCSGGKIEVRVNGALANEVSQCAPASGKLGFQLEGAPFELRNVTMVEKER